MDIEEIIENFDFLEDWDDRYKYLIELGTMLPEYPDQFRDSDHKVQGCVSQVWLRAVAGDGDDPVIVYYGSSDAHIVSGLVAIGLAIFSGKKASDILAIDETQIFRKLDLSEHITPQRSNGLRALVQHIKDEAQTALHRA